MNGYNGSPTAFYDLTTNDPIVNRKYVDAMFFAHDHVRKYGTYNGVPYLEAGCNGKNIGELTLSINNGNCVYMVQDCSTNVIWADTSCTVADPAIEAITQKEEYAEIIALADVPIYTFKNAYSQESFTEVVCMAMYWYVNSNKEKFDNTTVYFASHNTGGIRSEVSSGVFTRRDLIKVFPFDNLLSIQTCTSSHISYMKSNDYYRTYQPGEIVYDEDGYTKAISITYITEYKYAYYYQKEYKNYDMTAKDALVAYLTSGVNDNL